MKMQIICFSLFATVLIWSSCNNGNAAKNMKDLDENMLDMMTYHDNLGRYLRDGNLDYASWLLEGMDSSLKVISNKFTSHRKLKDPFRISYKKLLQPSIKEIREALIQKNIPEAVSNYRILTKKCNGCHIDHDINKVVIDWSLGEK
jgi:hypothetical protein